MGLAVTALAALWLAAWAGLTVADRLGLGPVGRVYCGLAGCLVAAHVIVVAYLHGVARGGRR